MTPAQRERHKKQYAAMSHREICKYADNLAREGNQLSAWGDSLILAQRHYEEVKQSLIYELLRVSEQAEDEA